MSADAIEYSVIVPLYNKQDSIPRALESILRQTHQPAEIIVVDDGSADRSVDRVNACSDSRIRLIQQENAGVSAARNHGIRASGCRYIAFLDADDAWRADHLSALASLIRRFPEAGAFATSYLIKEPGSGARNASLLHVPRDPQGGILQSYLRCIAYGHNPVWSSAVCVPRSTFDTVGMFPEGVRLYEDLHMWTRIALVYPIAYVDSASATYFKDAENRACNSIVPAVQDLEFSSVLLSAIREGRIVGDEARYAQKFIDRYALLNAFKAINAGHSKEARVILDAVRAREHMAKVRKLLLLGMSFIPKWCANAIWRSGVAFKMFRSRLLGGWPTISDWCNRT